MAGKEWKKKVYENEFGTVLKKYNVETVIAWQVLPKGEQLTIETFEKYFKDQNIDAVLVAVETGCTCQAYMGPPRKHTYLFEI